jgi:hypothetical protein
VSKLKFEKRLLVVMVLFLLPIMAQAKTVSYKKGIKQIAKDIGTKLSTQDTLAIVDFNATATTIQFKNSVIDDLTNELLEIHKVRMVERRDIDEIRKEQNYQQSGYVDDASAVEMGRELGATVILLGSRKSMVGYYQFSFRLLSVETARILVQSSVNVRATTLGARLGPGIEFNTADEDMVGSPEDDGFKPNEESNTAFNAVLYGAFHFNEVWTVQSELNFMMNNGIKISGHGNLITIDYTTLDIPLLVRWNFMQSPVVAGVIIGPYVSLPVGALNLKVDDRGGSGLDLKGWTLGATGGFALGYKIGPGSLITDLRFIHDIDLRFLNDRNKNLNFETIRVRDDFGDGVQDANICVRRSLNITIGYELYL